MDSGISATVVPPDRYRRFGPPPVHAVSASRRSIPAVLVSAPTIMLLTAALSYAGDTATPIEPHPPTGTFPTTNTQLKDSGCFYHPYSLAVDNTGPDDEGGDSSGSRGSGGARSWPIRLMGLEYVVRVVG